MPKDINLVVPEIMAVPTAVKLRIKKFVIDFVDTDNESITVRYEMLDANGNEIMLALGQSERSIKLADKPGKSTDFSDVFNDTIQADEVGKKIGRRLWRRIWGKMKGKVFTNAANIAIEE